MKPTLWHAARLPGLTFGLSMGWLTGRRGFLRWFRNEWRPENVVMVVVAIVFGGLLSSLLASLIKEEGWSGAFVRHPWKTTVYLAVVVACALVTTIVVVR